MRGAFLLIVFAACCAADSAADESVRRLLIEFETATGSLAPRPAGQRLVPLPTLTFPFRIEARCPAGSTVDSVAVSIADTRKVLRPADSQRIEDVLRVPGKQLAPVAAPEFCQQGEEESMTAPLHIRGALSAQVSLRCRGEVEDVVSYETVPLQLALQCHAAGVDQPPASSAVSRLPGLDGPPM